MARIGLQLYTVKDEVASDLPGVLRTVSRIGFDGVEFAGIPAEPAEEIGALLRDLGLQASGIVVSLPQLQDKATFEHAIEYSYEIGSAMILFPWLPEPLRRDADAYRSTATLLNGFGRICAEHGLRLLYHTHGYEFARLGGSTGLEIIMQRCDDELVGLQIDTYWVQYGGADPLALYRRYAHRCPAIHVKDAAPGPEIRDTEVGRGTVDVEGIVRAALPLGTQWLIVEQEHFDRPPLDSVAISYTNLRRMTIAALNAANGAFTAPLSGSRL